VIAHVILLAPRPGIDAAGRKGVLDALEAAVRGTPVVRRCRIGRRVVHGLPGYEAAMRDDYQYCAILEFDNLEGLREYLQHPAHDAIAAEFGARAASALAYDYELVELDEAAGSII
jgi:hypothetical protein